MYIDMAMVKQMLQNVEVVLKEGNEDDHSLILLTKYNNREYFEKVYDLIKEYDETNYHKEITRIPIVNYKKYTFIFGMTYYSTGKAVLLIKIPNNEEPIVMAINTNFELDVYEICYEVTECISKRYFSIYDSEDYEFDMEGTLSKFSKWRKEIVINKGLHNKIKPPLESKPDEKVEITSDDDAMNILDKYIDMCCEKIYEINDNRFDILMANVKTFDIGTIHTLDELTNLVRFMYYEYEHNHNLMVYENPLDDDECLVEKCGLKFLLRHLDVILDQMLNVYLIENGDEIIVDEFITAFGANIDTLKAAYNVTNNLEMFYCSGELGVFDVENDVLLYQKNISELVTEIKVLDETNFVKSFYYYDQEMKQFFLKLIEETNFMDHFLGIVFTDPTLLRGFLESNEGNEDDF